MIINNSRGFPINFHNEREINTEEEASEEMQRVGYGDDRVKHMYNLNNDTLNKVGSYDKIGLQNVIYQARIDVKFMEDQRNCLFNRQSNTNPEWYLDSYRLSIMYGYIMHKWFVIDVFNDALEKMDKPAPWWCFWC